MKVLISGFLSVALSLTVGQAKQPNVVIIMADDLGYTDLGCYGAKDIRTPNIDKLAQEGAKFTNAYVTASMCGPSRAGFITGRFQSSFGYYENVSEVLDPAQGLPAGMRTVAGLMQGRGYVTGGVGKWHMGTADHQHPNALGYSDWFGFLGGGLTYYPLDHPNYKGRYETLPRPWGVRDMQHTMPVIHNREPVDWKRYITHELTDAGVAFIEKNVENPFFLFMSYNAPHLELEAPVESIAKYPEASMTKLPKVTARARAIYAAMVDEMDQGIGQLMSGLEKEGLTGNTIVWFLSDHGGLLKTSDNRPLRGGKGSFFEGGLRVPMIVRWPEKVKPDTVLHDPVSSLDIGATSLAMAGGDPVSSGLHGLDLTRYLTGEATDPPHNALYWRTAPPGQESGIVREGDFKLLIQRGKKSLFNLEDDISEASNISNQHPKLMKRLYAQWKEWDKMSQAPLWTNPNKGKYQYADYDWLKGSPHYRETAE